MEEFKLDIGDTISGEIVLVWATVTNTELTEGRGQSYDKSYHLTKNEAVIAAEGIGVMGQLGKVEERKALKLSPTTFIILPKKAIRASSDFKQRAELRKQALAKLSEAEKVALLGK